LSVVVNDLAFSYSETPVLRDANIRFDERLVHLVLGSTGSGKTTLALLMAGLLRPQAGSITVDGTDPASDAFDRSRLQLAFQFPETQIFETSVAAEIEYGLRNLGVSRIRQRCEWALERMGLAKDLLGTDPDNLSFGERRRVALASVLALRPKYLILDEPLAGLDWHGRQGLIRTIQGLKEDGVTTMILTHETDMVAEAGDTVSMVACRQVSGPVPVLEFLYSMENIGDDLLPDSVAILRNIQSAGFHISARPRRIEDVARVLVETLGPGENPRKQ
jgi:energy-coupling factor transporter ATP-binding protein EcfA2